MIDTLRAIFEANVGILALLALNFYVLLGISRKLGGDADADDESEVV